jgi:hypothetical protein
MFWSLLLRCAVIALFALALPIWLVRGLLNHARERLQRRARAQRNSDNSRSSIPSAWEP